MTSQIVNITPTISVGKKQPLLLIAGPCQIESLEHCLMIANYLQTICAKLSVNLVFKASYDKANRTSINAKRGPGLDDGLEILSQVKEKTGLAVLSDIHLPEQASVAATVLDVIQIPAFLCRQTDLLLAAAKTGKAINVKKGQFLHPADMQHVAKKIADNGNNNVMLCERGTSFGYRDLVVDMRGLVIMSESGYPVIFDATHSVQSLGGKAGHSGGQREYIAPLARAAAAVGIDGLFLECHEKPESAPSDAESMLPLTQLEPLLSAVLKIRGGMQA